MIFLENNYDLSFANLEEVSPFADSTLSEVNAGVSAYCYCTFSLLTVLLPLLIIVFSIILMLLLFLFASFELLFFSLFLACYFASS